MRVPCADCGAEFDNQTKGTWSQVVGWAVNRSAGGANAVREKTETGLYRCPPCGKTRDLGLDPNQGTLV